MNAINAIQAFKPENDTISIIQLREGWLLNATQYLSVLFKRVGAPLPDNVRVACGFTSTGSRGAGIGECWSKEVSGDQTFEIFIKPNQDNSLRVLDILAHELVHVAVGIAAGHGPKFRRVAVAIGLEGKMTATTGSEAFKRAMLPFIEAYGEYPHAQLSCNSATTAKPKQSTRLLKACCVECGYTVRVSRKWFDVAPPICPDATCRGYGVSMSQEQ